RDARRRVFIMTPSYKRLGRLLYRGFAARGAMSRGSGQRGGGFHDVRGGLHGPSLVEPRFGTEYTDRAGNAARVIEIRCCYRDRADENLATADKISVLARAGQVCGERRLVDRLGERPRNFSDLILIEKCQDRFATRAAPQMIGFAKAA